MKARYLALLKSRTFVVKFNDEATVQEFDPRFPTLTALWTDDEVGIAVTSNAKTALDTVDQDAWYTTTILNDTSLLELERFHDEQMALRTCRTSSAIILQAMTRGFFVRRRRVTTVRAAAACIIQAGAQGYICRRSRRLLHFCVEQWQLQCDEHVSNGSVAGNLRDFETWPSPPVEHKILLF